MIRWLVTLAGASLALAEPPLEVVRGWPAPPEGRTTGQCSAVGVDARNRVFVFHRSGRQWTNPFPDETISAATVSVFDGASGRLLNEWGAGRFIMPHGLTVDHEGNIWLTDVGLQQVFKCTPEGRVLMTLGEARVPGDDAAHFNLPTDVAVLRDGSFYVSDGYRNSRVIKFTAAGRFDFQWGARGTAAGEFHLPHGIAVDARGRVIVCDRENLRLQVFDARGTFLEQWSGPEIGKPYGVAVGPEGRVFVIDGGQPSLKPASRGRAVELDSAGRLVSAFGGAGGETGPFKLGHDIATGPDGAVYIAEVAGERVRKFHRKP